MKSKNNILIIGSARCGTTSLGKSLSNQIGSYVSEPWNTSMPIRYSFTKDWKEIKFLKNTVFKVLSDQKPFNFNNTTVEFLKKIVNIFGKERTLFICRKNLDEHILSYTNLKYKIFVHGYNSGKAHLPWRTDSIPDSFFNNKQVQAFVKKDVVLQRENLFKVADIFNKDIIWYEDLYGSDRELSLELINSLNLDIDSNKLNDQLHPRFKYNKTYSQTLI